MQYDVLVVGQGISGTFLTWFLSQAGISYFVIDENRPSAPSRIAAGIINPVTGRRMVKTWMIDELMPFARKAYQSLGKNLQIETLSEKSLLDFFPSPQMRLAFMDRIGEGENYLSLPGDEGSFREHMAYDFGYGIIHPVYLVHLQDILPAWRKKLAEEDRLREEYFEQNELETDKGLVRYRDIIASRIVFCEGSPGWQNRWFKNLPFASNKGEAVWVEIKDLPEPFIYKKGFSLVPWDKEIFWLGSNYLWEFDDPAPTSGFLQFAENWLKLNIRHPFRILDHRAAVRPATLERRPFVGFHPLFPQIGILNGMGTKGCSLAPWFASQLVQCITAGIPVQPDASVDRFGSLLRKFTGTG